MKIAFLGDIALGDHPKCVGYGFGSTYSNGIPSEKSQRLLPADLEVQLAFANLEFPLYKRTMAANEQRTVDNSCCRGLPEYAHFLHAAGLSMVNVANNHIYQHGDAAFSETLKALAEAGIRTCGTPLDFTGEQIFICDDTRIAFLGWSDRPRQYLISDPPYNEVDWDACCQAVTEMKTKADIICVSLHWGDEFIEVPGNDDRSFARKLIDAGASLVVGHHSHVLREVEEYNGGLIAYSLGNNVCDMLWDDRTRETACWVVEFEAAVVKSWQLYPGRIGEDYFPTYLAGDARSKFLDVLNSRFKCVRLVAEKSPYQQLANNALKRHQKLTALHFIRNLTRFDKAVLFDALSHAIGRRVISAIRRD